MRHEANETVGEERFVAEAAGGAVNVKVGERLVGGREEFVAREHVEAGDDLERVFANRRARQEHDPEIFCGHHCLVDPAGVGVG